MRRTQSFGSRCARGRAHSAPRFIPFAAAPLLRGRASLIRYRLDSDRVRHGDKSGLDRLGQRGAFLLRLGGDGVTVKLSGIILQREKLLQLLVLYILDSLVFAAGEVVED